MKKLFAVLIVGLMIAFGAQGAMAEQPFEGAGTYIHSVTGQLKYFEKHPGDQSQWSLYTGDVEQTTTGTTSAYGMISGGAFSDDYANDYHGNDGAHADGWGYSSGENSNTASSKFFWKVPAFSQQAGFVTGENETHTWADVDDFGLSSKSKAGAVTEGWAFAGGEAFGLSGQNETSYTKVGVEGFVQQNNFANETGYDGGTFAQGGNYSNAGFTAWTDACDNGQTYFLPGAATLEFIEGKAITVGETFVVVDPYGNHRSAFAMTKNFSKVEVDDFDYLSSNVYGNGIVGAVAQNGNTWAGGNAGFSYNGATFGTGKAVVDAKIYTGKNYSSFNVTSKSFSVANGGSNNTPN